MAACLQLHAWQLHKADGVPASLRKQLLAETTATHLGVDIAQWEQDLAAAQSQSSSSVTQYIQTLSSDAGAVALDCAALGVRNTQG